MPGLAELQNRSQRNGRLSPARGNPDKSHVTGAYGATPAREQALGNQETQQLLRAHVIQAKLKVGRPGDVYEQEADRVADAVIRMSEPSPTASLGASGHEQANRIQRMCPKCEEEAQRPSAEPNVSEQIHGSRIQPVCSECDEELTRQASEEEGLDALLQTKEVASHTVEVTPDMESRIDVLRAGGRVLPESVRVFFEPRLGYDFGEVRIHTGPLAEASARELGALAYTVGKHIVFAPGRYAPGTQSGRQLLAHELTHVVQQRQATIPMVQAQGGKDVDVSEDPCNELRDPIEELDTQFLDAETEMKKELQVLLLAFAAVHFTCGAFVYARGESGGVKCVTAYAALLAQHAITQAALSKYTRIANDWTRLKETLTTALRVTVGEAHSIPAECSWSFPVVPN